MTVSVVTIMLWCSRLEARNTQRRREVSERYDFADIIGTSAVVRQMNEQVAQVAGTNTTVLIRGESGTGKELIAHAIHDNSLRKTKPFVRVNCAAPPDALLELELFGYPWPGNVRELDNVLEHAVLVCGGHVLQAHHLPPTLQTAETSGAFAKLSLSDAMEIDERGLIRDALKTTRGNRAKAARLLDTTQGIINYKIKKLGIDCRRFKM